MTQTSFHGTFNAHPSGMCSVTGKTEAGRELEVYFDGKVILDLLPYLEHNDHVGHANWHRKNPTKKIPCSSCHKAPKLLNQPYPIYFLYNLNESTSNPIDSYTSTTNFPDDEAHDYFKNHFRLGAFAHIIRKQTVLLEDIVEQL